MVRSFATAFVVTVGLVLSALAVPAAARADAGSPVLLIHGLSPFGNGHNCSTYWSTFGDGLRAAGYTGEFRTVAYYRDDTSCNTDIRQAANGRWQGANELSYTKDTSIKRLGADLAWHVYNQYSSKGRYVNLVGHSMGGLVMRAAISYTSQRDPSFPPSLLIGRNVTFGTPHDGAVSGAGCLILDNYQQCAEMANGSRFLAGLGKAVGTGPWAAIGSEGDTVVPCGSATWGSGPISIGSGSKQICYVNPAYDHGGYLTDPSGRADATVRDAGAVGGPEWRAAAFAARFLIG